MAGPDSTDSQKRRRRGRTIRRLVVLGIVAPPVLAVLATRSPVMKAAVLPVLERSFGVDIEAATLNVSADLRVVATGVRVRLPDVDGPGGEIAQIDRLGAQIDWLGLLTGSPRARRVVLESPRVRVSQDARTGALPIASLAAVFQGGGSSGGSIPTLVLRGGALELGEILTDGTYDELATLALNGELVPTSDGGAGAAGNATFTLTVDPPDVAVGAAPIEVRGLIDESGAELRVGGLALEYWPADAVPSSIRPTYESVALEGRVIPRVITIAPDGLIAVTVELDRVGLNLPFDPSGRADEGAEPLRLTGVDGATRISNDGISVEISGQADRLTYEVELDYWGFAPDSPFACRLSTRPFRLEQDARLLEFMPSLVLDRLALFGPPSAEIRGEFWLERGLRPENARAVATAGRSRPQTPPVPDESDAPRVERDPDEIDLVGVVTMRRGGGAFQLFPYPLVNAEGRMVFDRRFLWLTELTGEGPGGGTLHATAWVGPLTDEAQLSVTVETRDVPIDDTLRTAMDDDQRALLDELFDEEKLEALRAAGVVADPTWPTDQEGAPPDFALGGEANITVEVTRPYGLEQPFETLVTIGLDEIGVVAGMFPVPIIGRDVVLEIDADTARVTAGAFEFVEGGNATLTAAFPLDGTEIPRALKINAQDIPVTPALLGAIGTLVDEQTGVDQSESDADGGEPFLLTEFLPDLGLGGTIDAWATLGEDDLNLLELEPTGDPNELPPFTVQVRLHDASARPVAVNEDGTESPGLVALNDITGVVYVNPATLNINVDGTIESDAGGAAPATVFVEIIPPGELWGTAGDPTFFAQTRAKGISLETPAESLAEPYAPELTDTARSFRADYTPTGRLDLEARAIGRLGDSFVDEFEANVTASGLDGVRFAVLDDELSLRSTRGRIRYETTGPSVTADAAVIALRSADAHEAMLRADGLLPLGDLPPPGLLDGADSSLRLKAEGLRFESELVRRATQLFLGPDGQRFVSEWNPRGRFAVDAAFFRDRARPAEVELTADGFVRPLTLDIDTPSGSLSFSRIDGSVGFTPEGGDIEDIRAVGDGVEVTAEGSWRIESSGDAVLESIASVDIQPGVGAEPLLALLPPEGAEALRGIGFTVDGALSAPDTEVELRRTAEGQLETYATGELRVAGVGLEAGIEATEIEGAIGFEGWLTREGEGGFSLDLSAERARLNGIRVTNVTGQVISGIEEGVVLLPDLAADAHGGRITARGRITPPESESELANYWAEVRLGDVRLAPLLEDTKAGDTTLAEAARAAGSPEDLWSRDDRSRGAVDGQFTLSGLIDNDDSRRGRGYLKASGGPVVLLPGLTPLIEFSSLQAPVGDTLELAELELYVRGNELTFERIGILSRSIELAGYGTMTLPESELDLRFRSRGLKRIPFISDAVESLRDEIVTTTVTGPLEEPVVGTEAFGGTRSVFGALFGSEESAQSARIRQIAREARASRLRELRSRRVELTGQP